MMVMIVTTILSLRGLAAQAVYGYTSVFWYLLSAVLFLLPFSMVCAELASTYTHSGGVFRWVGEAFGIRWGWVAMCMEWMMLVILFPAILMFCAVSLAYIFGSESFGNALASNAIYTLIMVLAVYWLSTFNAFRSIGAANRLSTCCGLFGTIIPGALLIVLTAIYLCTGGENFIPADKPFWPDFSDYGTIVLAAGIFLFYGGMEMQAVHVTQMSNPQKQFPKAVLGASAIILVGFMAGSLCVAAVTPGGDINLLQSLLVTYKTLWAHLGLGWLGNVTAAMIAFGVIGQVSVFIAGPSTGILAVGRAGFLPKWMQKVNSKGVQTNILLLQGGIVSFLSLVLIVLPSVQSAYQIMNQMATIIYLALVLVIYMAFLRLRRTEPEVKRGFRVPGGKAGAYITGITGIAGAVAAIILSFLPPVQIATGSPVVYVGLLLGGTAAVLAIPFIIYKCRKPSWHDPDTNFTPFYWQSKS